MKGSRSSGRLFSSRQALTPSGEQTDPFEMLSPQIRNILLKNGLTTTESLRHIAEMPEKDLLRWPKVGKVIAAEIMRAARALAGSPDTQS